MNNLLRQNHIRRATEKYALLVPLISEMMISRWIPREMSQYHCGSIPIVFQVSPIMYAKYQLSVGYIPDCIITVSSLYGAMTYVCLWFPMGIFQKKNRTMVSPCIILLGCILMLIPFNAQMIIRNIISFISFTVSLYCPISSVSCAPQFFMVDTICWKRISDDITTTSKKMQPCLITILAWFSCSIVWSLL